MKRVGLFELEALEEQGPGGGLWQGRHAGSQQPVGVRLLENIDRAQSHGLRSILHQLAATRHPSLPRPLGLWGSPLGEARVIRKMPPGAFLWVEERSAGPALALPARPDWTWLRTWLAQVLDALAHLHARGLTHGGLRVRAIRERPGGGIWLREAGLEAALSGASGAPRPRRDLNQLAVVVYQVLTGRPPYREGTGRPVRHLPPPRLRRPWLSDDFEDWLHTLLSEEISFSGAAEALGALMAISGQADPPELWTLRPLVEDELGAELEELSDSSSESSWEFSIDDAVRPVSVPFTDAWWGPSGAPPLEWPDAPLQMLRDPPLRSREGEQALLWDELGAVHRSGRARLVLLRGMPGTGRGRLLRWFCTRAAELGVGHPLRVQHTLAGSACDGLVGLCMRALGTVGLSRSRAARRVELVLRELGVRDPYEWLAMSELVQPQPAGQGTVRFSSERERYALLVRLFKRLSLRRPVILWVSELQWGADTLGLLSEMMAYSRKLPVLVVATADPIQLMVRPLEQRLLEEALARSMGRSLELDLEPLDPELEEEVLGEAFELAPSLLPTVMEFSFGLPLAGRQLLGDWLQRGLLTRAAGGWEARPGVELSAPDQLGQVWRSRFERLLSAEAPEGLAGLEAAAVLGQHFQPARWEELCRVAGVSRPHAIAERLVEGGLWVDDRWSGQYQFVHIGAWETAVELCRSSGRWWVLHRAAAQALKRGNGADRRRRLRHLELSDQVSLALDEGLLLAEQQIASGELLEAESILTRIQQLLSRRSEGATDPRGARAERMLQQLVERRASSSSYAVLL